MADRILSAFVEHHENVAAEGQLRIHRGFRGEGVEIAIQVRLKHHSMVCDLAQSAQTEYLVTARIRENGVRPGHESVQSAQLADELVARAKVEVIGVGQEDLHTEFFSEVALGETFDGRSEERRVGESVD